MIGGSYGGIPDDEKNDSFFVLCAAPVGGGDKMLLYRSPRFESNPPNHSSDPAKQYSHPVRVHKVDIAAPLGDSGVRLSLL